jgi:hypothetical protein
MVVGDLVMAGFGVFFVDRCGIVRINKKVSKESWSSCVVK